LAIAYNNLHISFPAIDLCIPAKSPVEISIEPVARNRFVNKIICVDVTA
jgi:hypothetical protein